MSEGQDVISWCPSILHILDLLKYDDVARCQRVNRRISEVIGRNIHSWPIAPTRFEIKTSKPSRNMIVYELLVQDASGCSRFLLQKKQIRVISCTNRWMQAYFRRQDSIPSSECYPVYRTASPGKEIYSLLSVVFQHSDVKLILSDARALSKDFLFRLNLYYHVYRTKMKCVSLHVDSELSDLSGLCDRIECTTVHISTTRTWKGSQWSFLRNITFLHLHYVKILIHPSNCVSLQPIIDLLERWRSGHYNILGLELYHQGEQEFRWSKSDMGEALGCLRPTQLVQSGSTEEFPIDSLFLKLERPSDHQCLRVKYSQIGRRLAIERMEP